MPEKRLGATEAHVLTREWNSRVTQGSRHCHEQLTGRKDRSRMKISVIMDISVFRFCGYIGDISADILEKNIDRLKIVKNLCKCKENLIII